MEYPVSEKKQAAEPYFKEIESLLNELNKQAFIIQPVYKVISFKISKFVKETRASIKEARNEV